MKTIEIKQPENKPPIAAEIIATSIIEIAAAMKRIDGSRLKRRVIVTLIHEESKIPRRDIEIVLNNLSQLEQIWLKPKP